MGEPSRLDRERIGGFVLLFSSLPVCTCIYAESGILERYRTLTELKTKRLNMGVVTKRSSMLFYSDGSSQYSHRVRIVLAEKGVTVDIVDVDVHDKPEDLADLNPYNSLPTLVDRDLVLYEPNIMMEYLDERFPASSFIPGLSSSPCSKPLWMHRIEKDWCALVDMLQAEDGFR